LLEFTASDAPPIEGNPWRAFLQGLRESGCRPADMSLEVMRAFAWKSQWTRPKLLTVFQYAALQSVTPLQVLTDPVGSSSRTLPLADSVVRPRREVDTGQSRNQRHLQYAAALLCSSDLGWPLPFPGWLAIAFDCSRSGWAAADKSGYIDYRSRFGARNHCKAIDRRLFEVAIQQAQDDLNEGSHLTVRELCDRLASKNESATSDQVATAALRALQTLGVFRLLRRGERLTMERGRIRVGDL
jgi:hypothetical protein